MCLKIPDIKGLRREALKWEKTYAKDTNDKGLLSRILKKTQNSLLVK